MLEILLLWVFLGAATPAILLLISGNIDKLFAAINLCIRYFIWALVLASPAIFIWLSQRVQLGSVSWEWVSRVDPDTVEDLLWVIGIIWVASLPVFLISTLLRTVLESAPSFLEDMRTLEHEPQQETANQQETQTNRQST